MNLYEDNNFQKKKLLNKDLIKTIIIVALILVLLGLFLIPKYNQSIYEKAFTKGQMNIIQTQMQTGEIFITNNNTIQTYPVSAFCGG